MKIRTAKRSLDEAENVQAAVPRYEAQCVSSDLLTIEKDSMTHPTTKRTPQTRKTDRLKDAVYREMFLLESNRPGSEMGLALALLRAVIGSESLLNDEEFLKWIKTVCPIGLQMIEASLKEVSKCNARMQ